MELERLAWCRYFMPAPPDPPIPTTATDPVCVRRMYGCPLMGTTLSPRPLPVPIVWSGVTVGGGQGCLRLILVLTGGLRPWLWRAKRLGETAQPPKLYLISNRLLREKCDRNQVIVVQLGNSWGRWWGSNVICGGAGRPSTFKCTAYTT